MTSNNCLHELVSVMHVGNSLPGLPQQQAHIVLLQQGSLIGLQQGKGHPEKDLGPFLEECVPHPCCSLQQTMPCDTTLAILLAHMHVCRLL